MQLTWRSNLKTQPTKTYTRLADGVRGAEDLWAFAKTTRLGATTFTGVKTFNDNLIFVNDVEIQDTVTVKDNGRFIFDDPSISLDTPRYKISDTTAGNMLWFESGTSTPARHVRGYVGSDDVPIGSGAGGVWVTTNAKQDPGTGDWEPDSAGAGLAGITQLGLGGVFISQKIGTPASWPDAEWRVPASSSDAALYTSINGYTLQRGMVDSTDLLAFFNGLGATLPFTVNEMDLGQLGGQSFLLADLYQETSDAVPMPARVYATAGDGGSSPKLVSVVTNALYDFAAQTWSADSPAASGQDAFQVGLSGLHGVMARKRANTTGTWADSGWLEIMRLGTASLALNSGYEFGWLSNKSITHAISTFSGIPSFSGTFQPSWIISFSSWGSTRDQNGVDDHLSFPLPIPDGANTLVVEVIVNPGIARAVAADRMQIKLVSRTINWGAITGTAFASSGAAEATDDGTTNPQVVSVSYALSGVAGEELALRIQPGSDGATNPDVVTALRVTYNVTRLTSARKG